jgi:hypothetical protein
MIAREPIKFKPCKDTGCHYFKEYTMKFDQKGQPYGLGMDGPFDALFLCNLCSRRVQQDFYFNLKDWQEEQNAVKKGAEEKERAQN